MSVGSVGSVGSEGFESFLADRELFGSSLEEEEEEKASEVEPGYEVVTLSPEDKGLAKLRDELRASVAAERKRRPAGIFPTQEETEKAAAVISTAASVVLPKAEAVAAMVEVGIRAGAAALAPKVQAVAETVSLKVSAAAEKVSLELSNAYNKRAQQQIYRELD